jgi:hypothetical protein
MRYRPRWTLLGLGAIIVALLFTYPTWRTLLTGRASTGAFALASAAQQEVFANMSKSNREAAASAYVAMLTVVPAPTTEQPTPVLPDAQAIKSGDFIQIDAVHLAKGRATLYRSADGSLLLRFDDFSVTNGPQLRVYLSGTQAPRKRDELDTAGVSAFPVGALKGSLGNQQFTIPKELKIANYKSVVIFSESLSEAYSSAPLQ